MADVRRAGWAVVATIAIVVASCGGDDGEDGSSGSDPSGSTTTSGSTSTTGDEPAAAGADVVVVSINGPSTIVEVVRDATTVEPVAEVDGAVMAAAFAAGSVWIGLFDRVAVVDVETGDVQDIPIPGAVSGVRVFADGDAVWASSLDGPLARIDATSATISGEWDTNGAPFPSGATAVGAAGGNLYLVGGGGSELVGFDGETVNPAGTLPFEQTVSDGAATSGTTLFLGDIETGTVAIVDGESGATSAAEVTRPLLVDDQVQEAGRSVTLTPVDDGVLVTFGPANALSGTAPDAPVNGFAVARVLPDGTVTPDDRFDAEQTVVAEAGGVTIVQTVVGIEAVSEAGESTPLATSGALVDSVFVLPG